ncbi:sterol-sensing domain of SREBP cleavage-activation-domain-containing protein [Cunninghamella echinulata]|nr:sterol-sensing domain of SREBP cleavage-activation-domain-containing protein [Cunninghamella echinulata]
MQLSSSHISSQKNISYFKYVQLPTHFAAGPSIQPLSLFGNVTYDVYGNFVSADSIIITMFLQPKQHFSKDDIDFIWNSLWDDVATRSNINIIKDISDNIDSPSSVTSWSLRIKSKNQTWYYKYKLIPVGLSLELALSILVYFLMFYLISTAFAKSTQVKSHYLFGFASLFSAVATCTTTLGLLQLFGIELKLMPWYLYPLICGVASLENIFLLTQAVLYSGCDMRVTEKIARGLQSVGVPMTLMLIAEIMILYIGSAIDSELVQEFCFFTKFALIVEYIMVYTFFIAFLSIDVKRLEVNNS